MHTTSSSLRSNTKFWQKFQTVQMLRGISLLFLVCVFISASCFAGAPQALNGYKVLPTITRGNLEIFPVVGVRSQDTSQLMTLDEGVRSGEVIVTEAGDDRGLVRPGQIVPPRRRGAEVNRLVLYNNSNRPLLLLAGEIVTGGKQDRVIGADRIVPPKSGPIDVGVFCVEPGRWVVSTDKFGSMQSQMAQPSVRTPAMAAKDQRAVWDNVGVANRRMAENAGAAGGVVGGVTSYAKVFASAPVQEKLASYGGTEDERMLISKLRSLRAVGVVVAINGRVIWADIFASTELLSSYWPKLYKSYVAEAITSGRYVQMQDLTEHDAQAFINDMAGGREIVETEAGVYRRAEISGDGYRVFQLTSLLPKAEFDVHITKMRN